LVRQGTNNYGCTKFSRSLLFVMMMMMMMMTTTTKLKRKMGGEKCLRVFNGGKVKQSDRWENIIIDGQENTKMCVKKQAGKTWNGVI